MALKLTANLSRRDRTRTPLAFALALVGLCRSINQLRVNQVIRVGFCDEDTVYHQIPNLDVYTSHRPITSAIADDSRPIIMHPPCGGWGKFRHVSRQELIGGCLAVEVVEEFGGIVEQPVGSRLFKGRTIGIVLQVNQVHFGHPALKPTLLYCVGKDHLANKSA